MINVVYNPFSRLAPKGGARRSAKYWTKKLEKAGLDCILRPLDEKTDLSYFVEMEMDIRSQIDDRSLCWLIIYDDQQKRKYITNESEMMSFEDVAGYFKSRQERRLEMELILERLHAEQTLATI